MTRRRPPLPEQVCPGCRETFTPRRPGDVNCTIACRDLSAKARARGEVPRRKAVLRYMPLPPALLAEARAEYEAVLAREADARANSRRRGRTIAARKRAA